MKKPNFKLNLQPDEVAKKVLLTPDSESCAHVAETYFKNAVKFNEGKNYTGYTGTYLDKPLTVINAGIGMASAGLLTKDLFEAYGVESVVYLGLCDGLKKEIEPRQYVLVQSASTDSNYADFLGLPGNIAPTADFSLTCAIAEDFRARKSITNAAYENPVLHIGTVLSSDDRIEDSLIAAEWTESGAIAADTATAAIFLQAQKVGKRAAALLLVDRNLETGEEMKDSEFQRCTMRQIVLAMSNI